MKQLTLTAKQAQELLQTGETVFRKPVRPGRGQNWLKQEWIDTVKEVEFDGGEWLVLKHPQGSGNLTCIRNIVGKVGDLRAHRTLTMQIASVKVERMDKWVWVIALKRLEKEAGNDKG